MKFKVAGNEDDVLEFCLSEHNGGIILSCSHGTHNWCHILRINSNGSLTKYAKLDEGIGLLLECNTGRIVEVE